MINEEAELLAAEIESKLLTFEYSFLFYLMSTAIKVLLMRSSEEKLHPELEKFLCSEGRKTLALIGLCFLDTAEKFSEYGK